MLPERAQSLIRLLASPNDGEALNALRALARVLNKDGIDFHDLAKGFVVKETVREAPRQANGGESVNGHAEVEELLKRGEMYFRPAEWEFLNSINRWRREFTPKQREWLNDIKAKVERRT